MKFSIEKGQGVNKKNFPMHLHCQVSYYALQDRID